ncbi:hypothetical protein GCM10010466_21660 [Planomonospora alba]|uniref:Uncharacterized protein n=1 Tax=Planomonospora alba TaxID=161354 RepID=A0ABP6MYP8_9ACTN
MAAKVRCALRLAARAAAAAVRLRRGGRVHRLGGAYGPAVAKAASDHHPSSRQVPAGERYHAVASPFTGTGAGGGPPAAAPPPAVRHLPPGLFTAVRPARDDDPRPLAALLVRSGRAPPSTGG